jgi:type II secretory pathway pseudopilin PulG
MTKSALRSSAGFTYIAALVMVVIVGIMVTQSAELWSTKMQREREVELIFRGTQIRNAMRRWYGFTPPAALGTLPAAAAGAAPAAAPAAAPPRGNLPELKALVVDPNMASKVHFLRASNLVDPMTGKEWGLVKDATQKIIGVASTSDAAPLKQANFPFDLVPADFEGKKKYSEWQFIYNRVPTPGATGGGITGLKTSATPTDKTGP